MTNNLSSERNTNWPKSTITDEVCQAMVKAISCGYCGETTTIESEYTCKICGRMLCPECGERWGWCKDHIPKCAGYSFRHASVEMIGNCRCSMVCPVCGWGWGSDPCPHSPSVIYKGEENE